MYRQYIRFLLPLILTMVVYNLSTQFLNGGMARMPRALETLAAYGLAWGLADFIISPLLQVRQLGLALVDSVCSKRRVLLFVIVCSTGLGALLALLGLTALGDWVVGGLHQVEGTLLAAALTALWGLALVPLLEGVNRLYSGILMRSRHTEVITYATLARIGASIGGVFALLPTPFIQDQPILLPLIVTYLGEGADLAVIYWGYRRYVKGELPIAKPEDMSLGFIGRFFWPLAMVMAIQGGSRPVINLFVARGGEGKEALAVLAVVYSLAHMPYGWVNELRSLPVAFRQGEENQRSIRLFSLGCGLVSFASMVTLFWTPLRDFILANLIGLEQDLVALCRWPLFWFSFFPLAVMVRAYWHGMALLQRRTQVLAPSGPARIGIIVLLMLALPHDIPGATRGIMALLSGFMLEMAVVWWGMSRSRKAA
jgi:hypothetical protein